MSIKPRLAIIAHDACKQDMTEWCVYNKLTLSKCELYATGTTGKLVEEATSLPITRLFSGPLGGDAQISAMIVENRLDCIIFFWDAMSSHPHDVDVKALLRLTVLYNVPTACNRVTADFIISSPLFFTEDMVRK